MQTQVAVSDIHKQRVVVDVARTIVPALHIAVADGRRSTDLVRRVAPQDAVAHRRAAGRPIVHPAAVVGGGVSAEGHIGQRRAGREIVHPAAVAGGVSAEGHIGQRRAAGVIEHPAARIMRITAAIRVPAGDAEAVQHGSGGQSVIIIIDDMVVHAAARESGDVALPVALAEGGFRRPGKAAVDFDARFHHKGVGRRGAGGIRARCHPDLFAARGSVNPGLQGGVGIRPGSAVVGSAGGAVIDVDGLIFVSAHVDRAIKHARIARQVEGNRLAGVAVTVQIKHVRGQQRIVARISGR